MKSGFGHLPAISLLEKQNQNNKETSNNTMNTRQNYRKQAEQRVKNTPEMRSLLHLFKRSWGNCDELWETLATRPTSEIIQFILDLNEYALTKTAYHEAGHLVIAILVGLEYEYATIVPGIKGEEYIRGHLYSGKDLVRHNGFAFFIWRRLVMFVAGAAATLRLTKEKPGECKSDMAAAVNILGKNLHQDVFSEWLEITGYSIVRLIDDSAIWTAIDWFAQQLLIRGTIQITPSIQKRIKKFIENSGSKPSAAFHLGRMLSACDNYTGQTNEELELQRDRANGLFYHEVDLLTDERFFKNNINRQRLSNEAEQDYLLNYITSTWLKNNPGGAQPSVSEIQRRAIVNQYPFTKNVGPSQLTNPSKCRKWWTLSTVRSASW